jgi:soluble lytic murein transglycosylase-like protein
MERYGHLDVELFVERIPFRETRDYVKKVLATAAIYRGLEGAPVELDLPARIGRPPATVTVTTPDR